MQSKPVDDALDLSLHGSRIHDLINNELILAVVGGALSTDYPFNEFLAYGSEDPKWSNNNTELDIPLENYDYGHLLLSNGETLIYINT